MCLQTFSFRKFTGVIFPDTSDVHSIRGFIYVLCKLLVLVIATGCSVADGNVCHELFSEYLTYVARSFYILYTCSLTELESLYGDVLSSCCSIFSSHRFNLRTE